MYQKNESIFTSDKEKKEKRELKRSNKRRKRVEDDDTPKAFARLMVFQQTGKRLPSGLDDGSKTKKQQKKERALNKQKSTTKDGISRKAAGDTTLDEAAPATTTSTSTTTTATAKTQAPLKILPGERLADFSVRVDQSLPLASVPKQQSRVQQIPGLEKLKPHLTKHNKRLARMQSEWRATEAKLRARREDEDDDLADQKEEDALMWLGAGIDLSAGGKKKKKGKGGKDLEDDLDPWKQLERKRRDEGDMVRQRNLQDVVQAPPVLKGVRNIFKATDERTEGVGVHTGRQRQRQRPGRRE